MSVGKITGAQLKEYQDAAIKYRKEFLAMIVIGIEEIKPYVTNVRTFAVRSASAQPTLMHSLLRTSVT